MIFGLLVGLAPYDTAAETQVRGTFILTLNSSPASRHYGARLAFLSTEGVSIVFPSSTRVERKQL